MVSMRFIAWFLIYKYTGITQIQCYTTHQKCEMDSLFLRNVADASFWKEKNEEKFY